MMMKSTIFLVVFALILIPVCAAESGSIKLLAVSETGDGEFTGSIADLSLEIRSGSGRVFVNTFPVPKLDTQISMRFAQQVACRKSGKDCSLYDFIYTIKASSGLVGGPSAGAAASVLTFAVLEGKKINTSSAITGTINSGELIGPVGGVKAKIDAAAEGGIEIVLVPIGESLNSTYNNMTAEEYGSSIGINVVEAATLDDALYYISGVEKKDDWKNLEVDPEYLKVMKSLSAMLCSRADALYGNYLNESEDNELNSTYIELENSSVENMQKAEDSSASGDYYTAASYCFRANINSMYLWNLARNLSSEEHEQMAEELRSRIEMFEELIENSEIRTITDMQAYMITKERIWESYEMLEKAEENLLNNTEDTDYWLAFANERLYSAYSWSSFLGNSGQEFVIDDSALLSACETKILEAEERFQYVTFYFPGKIDSVRDDIDRSKMFLKENKSMMCIYTASRAKAKANSVLSVIGVSDEIIDRVLGLKIKAAEKAIITEQEAGIFPIMGYSYFEYSKSLAETETASAILYADYSLELSNFDYYFEKDNSFSFFRNIDLKLFAVLIIGIATGYVASYISLRKRISIKKHKNPRKRPKGRLRGKKR